MKKFILFLIVLLLTGMASANFYPGKVDTNVPGAKNGMGTISIQNIGSGTAGPEPSDDDQMMAAKSLVNSSPVLVLAANMTAQPDYPRNLIVTPSGSCTGSMKFTGTDISGASITENLTFSGASIVASTKAFKSVSRIDGWFTQDATRTAKIGTGDKLGLNTKLSFNSVLYTLLNGVLESVAATVTTDSSVLSKNTADLNSALVNGSPVKVYYVIPA